MSKNPRHSPKFTKESLAFLLKASRQKRADWLERNRVEYEHLLLNPLKHLADELKSELSDAAPGYHFPQKGIGRLKRPAARAAEYGGLYRDWMHYSAAKPRVSRFEHNPNLYFMMNPSDRKDPVLIAGGLYMPSSRQMRSIRDAIASDASAFDELFKSRAFSRHFKGGFSLERSSKRSPRGFDPNHPRMNWLKLQAYFVWKPYSMNEFTSEKFPEIVVKDCRQILRMNAILESVISGRPRALVSNRHMKRQSHSSSLGKVIETVEAPRLEMDF